MCRSCRNHRGIPAQLRITVRIADRDAFTLNPVGALERFLHDVGARGVVSMNIPGYAGPTRFFVGTKTPEVSADRVSRLERLAEKGGQLLAAPLSEQESLAELRRLELAAGLLSTLTDVLDVRDVFDQLSAAANVALPHDLLQVILFNEDLTTVTVFARSKHESISSTAERPGDGVMVPSVYPPATIRAWRFDIIDDYRTHPLEQHSQAVKHGARSALRVPIRLRNRVIGGLRFFSFEPGRYTNTDVTSAGVWPITSRLRSRITNSPKRVVACRRSASARPISSCSMSCCPRRPTPASCPRSSIG